MSIYQTVYVSDAVQHFTKEELAELLAISRKNNERTGITGMLLYKGGNFIQVLEGEEAAVQALFERIARDPRHKGILTLLKRELPKRDFPDWSMAFRDLRDAELHKMPGYNELLNISFTGADMAEDGSKAMKLISLFATKMR